MERPTQTSLEIMQDKGYKQEKQLNFSKNAIILKKWKEYANYLENEIQELKKGAVESKKVVIPQFVADYIESQKLRGFNLTESYATYGVEQEIRDRIGEWQLDNKNSLDYARAWLDGYEAEKEPLYEVILPRVAVDNTDLHLRTSSDGVPYMSLIHNDCKKMFTEQEIKSIDGRYWAFRVPVEEDDERDD